MKSVTMYEAEDGTKFNDIDECQKYERLLTDIEVVMSGLHPTPKDDGCSFANGGGFLQQDPNVVINAKERIPEIYAKYTGQENPGWHGRCFCDSGITPIYHAYSRIACVDGDGREWGQQYFTNNPHEGKQIQLNK